ncbi:MAG: class I SAM-dependent methyltransferase, partial [Chloroflexales bacterium]|nr:class I SAM-dependent methyltransferase [Chloroflexales bacterium]
MTTAALDLPIDAAPPWEALPEDGLRPGGLALTRRALGLCDPQPGARLLDIGCGPGSSVTYAAEALGLT